ncbi:assembly chaperone of rpl4 [Penicillium macrosclerotiorum]|uniref:assembly chaperone of rpl4 n=1 Tax=Penicillium macrosclerotiorum TaxID=303699 RepID=UPI00254909D1|nr:assembly chaperone of rpl4 [Penicillium macrosclerotiorum]KAJ5679433.1 assembly chaperone of rpl4 [Penicillium macrosclerotiorum]
MGKPRPRQKKSKSRAKSVLGPGGSVSKSKMSQDPSTLLDQATILLQTGRADEALPTAQQALDLAAENASVQLQAVNLLGEINVELGDIDTARGCFLHAVELDPNGSIPDSEGGGAEKFLWLAQLSEQGGNDSVKWFEKGVSSLRQTLQSLQGKTGKEDLATIEEKKSKLSNALCAVAEIYMTDLSWEDEAETRCEALITEALAATPEAPEVLQTFASIRISQLKTKEAQDALKRSIVLWKDLAPEDPKVPEFAVRISLARLLMEVTLEFEALEVLERLILEDDQSVEAWYLGGWCLYLLAEKQEAPKDITADEAETPRHASLVASREWLNQSLKLYDLLEYEDERLRDHALELVQGMNQEIGEDMDDDSEAEGDGDEDWDEEIEADSDDDHEMADS